MLSAIGLLAAVLVFCPVTITELTQLGGRTHLGGLQKSSCNGYFYPVKGLRGGLLYPAKRLRGGSSTDRSSTMRNTLVDCVRTRIFWTSPLPPTSEVSRTPPLPPFLLFGCLCVSTCVCVCCDARNICPPACIAVGPKLYDQSIGRQADLIPSSPAPPPLPHTRARQDSL